MDIIFILLQVILLDGILSIDNAAAIAAIASKLPKKQQAKAVKAGILGAYIGRGLMILVASVIVSNPWLSLVAAAYLLYLVGTHFFNWKGLDFHFQGTRSFWGTVAIIEFADLAFSIDNVAAIVALSSHIWIIILGVCISIVIMRFAAQMFIKLIAWEPSLEHAAFILIGVIAIELIFKFFHFEISSVVQFMISMGIIALFILHGRLKRAGWFV
jgi:tellurite resistance protein TerC